MPVKKRRKPPKNDADAWLAAMGLSRRQWAEAASLIGLTHNQVLTRNDRSKDAQWSRAEKMAMMAAWLGLPEFTLDIYNLPEDSRSVILAAAAVIRAALTRKAMGVTEPEPAPDAEPLK